MIKGLLIYDKNRYEKNKWFAKAIIAQGRLEGLDIDLFLLEDEKDEESFFKRIKEPEFTWNFCFAIMRIANPIISEYLEARKKIVFNNSSVSQIANDKFSTYKFFKYIFDKEIKNIENNELGKLESLYQSEKKNKTEKTYSVEFQGNYLNRFMPTCELSYFLTKLEKKALIGEKGSLIIKSKTGHGGSEVYKINGLKNLDEFVEVITNKGFKIEDYIVQEMTDEVGKDLRVYMLGDRVLASVLRSSATDFRSNYSLGGKIQIYKLDNEVENIAKIVQSQLKSDLIGIDFIRNKGKWILNEIEDVVGLRSIYKLYDFNPIELYISYIKKKLYKVDKL